MLNHQPKLSLRKSLTQQVDCSSWNDNYRPFYVEVEILESPVIRLQNYNYLVNPQHYDAEVYPEISTLVKLARKLDKHNERNQETSFVSYFSQKGFHQFCELKEHSERKVG